MKHTLCICCCALLAAMPAPAQHSASHFEIDPSAPLQAIDGILRIIDHNLDEAEKVLMKIDGITKNIEVVVTVSADPSDLPEGLKKYVI